MTTTPPEDPQAPIPAEHWTWKERIEATSHIATAMGIAVAAVGVFYAAHQTELSRESMETSRQAAKVSEESLKASLRQLEETQHQLAEIKYESVYEHQLNLWQMAVEHPEVAPYIVGGKKPDDGTQSTQESFIQGELDPEERAAALEGALIQALDFYNYVYVQTLPHRASDGEPLPYALVASEPDALEFGITFEDWNDWATWAATIKDGFSEGPGMCTYLFPDREMSSAYREEFGAAVQETGLCDWWLSPQ